MLYAFIHLATACHILSHRVTIYQIRCLKTQYFHRHFIDQNNRDKYCDVILLPWLSHLVTQSQNHISCVLRHNTFITTWSIKIIGTKTVMPCFMHSYLLPVNVTFCHTESKDFIFIWLIKIIGTKIVMSCFMHSYPLLVNWNGHMTILW